MSIRKSQVTEYQRIKDESVSLRHPATTDANKWMKLQCVRDIWCQRACHTGMATSHTDEDYLVATVVAVVKTEFSTHQALDSECSSIAYADD